MCWPVVTIRQDIADILLRFLAPVAGSHSVFSLLSNRSIGTGFTNLLLTLIALLMVDRIGHHKLMLIGSAGLNIIYGMVAMAYASGVP